MSFGALAPVATWEAHDLGATRSGRDDAVFGQGTLGRHWSKWRRDSASISWPIESCGMLWPPHPPATQTVPFSGDIKANVSLKKPWLRMGGIRVGRACMQDCENA